MSASSIGDYNINAFDILGKGAFGIVYTGHHKSSGQSVAVKCVTYKEKGQIRDDLVKMGNTEFAIFEQLKGHPNVVQLLDHIDDGIRHWLIMEFCDLGDLQEYLSKNSVNFTKKLKILLEITNAIAFMHSLKAPIIHRDIKPTNILMMEKDDQHVAKVTDFGIGKLYEENPKAIHETMTTLAGTAGFMAPEFWSADGGNLRYKAGVDTFALGLVFHTVLDFENNPSMIPASIQSKAVIYFGLEMSNNMKLGQPMPTLFKEQVTTDSFVSKMQALILDMIKYNEAERIKPATVKERIHEICCDLLWKVDSGLEEQIMIKDELTHKKDYDKLIQDFDQLKQKNSELQTKLDTATSGNKALLKENQSLKEEITSLKQSNLQQLKPEVSDKPKSSVGPKHSVRPKVPPRPKGIKSGSGSTVDETKDNSKRTGNFDYQHSRVCHVPYNTVLKSLDQSSTEIVLGNDCLRMGLVDDNIWAPLFEKKTIKVIDSKTTRDILFQDISPFCIAQTNNQEVLIGSEQGLYTVSINGTVAYKVCNGDIDDISMSGNDTAIAYDSNSHQVLICKYINNRWKHTSQFSLEGKTQLSAYHTLLLHDGIIYVASNLDKKVLRFRLTGEYIDYILPASGLAGPRELSGPKVCGVDSQGSVLISDQGNQRLLVYSPRGPVWQEYQHKEFPKDVAVKSDNTVCVLHNNVSYGVVISKYEQN